MSELNYDILIKNIEMLRKNNGLTQAQLAERIGMSQANLSKALNPVESKRFNLDQVYRIAQYFGVSIDWLLAFTPSESEKFSFEDNAKWIARQVVKGYMSIHEVTLHETVCFPRDNGDIIYPEDLDVTYQALIFPQYFSVPENILDDDDAQVYETGNATGLNLMDEFLKKLCIIYTNFDNDVRDQYIANTIDSYKDEFHTVRTRL